MYILYQQNLVVHNTCEFCVDIYLNHWKIFVVHTTTNIVSVYLYGRRLAGMCWIGVGPEAYVSCAQWSPDLYLADHYLWCSVKNAV